MTTINLIKESRHTDFPDSIKVLQEFTSCFTPYTRIVDKNGKLLVMGLHVLVQGELDDIVAWCHDNQPVYLGTSTSPMMEQFAAWVDESYVEPIKKQEEFHFHPIAPMPHFHRKNSHPGSQRKCKNKRNTYKH